MPASEELAAPRLVIGVSFFFFGFLLATDNDLNIVDVFFDSIATPGLGASIIAVAVDSVVSECLPCPWISSTDEASAPPFQSELSPTFGAGSLLKPGAAPVFRLTPPASPPLLIPPSLDPPFGAAVRLGAGRKELKLPIPLEPVLARFAGGPDSESPSSAIFLAGSGRVTLIL